MYNIFKKIVKTGTVTEKWSKAPSFERTRGQVAINNSNCTKCYECLKKCPTKAIMLEGDLLKINHKHCIACGICFKGCKHHAIKYNNSYIEPITNANLECPEGNALARRVKRVFNRSLAIRHLDAGSCNACDWEMVALSNPYYDLKQYGIEFVASPRHADLLMVTGVVTRNLHEALMITYEAMATPKLVMAVGSCSTGANIYGNSYATLGSVDKFIPVDVYVPGCPPPPKAIIHGLMLALDKV